MATELVDVCLDIVQQTETIAHLNLQSMSTMTFL